MIKSAVDIAKEIKGSINPRYNINAESIEGIHNKSEDVFGMICNSFNFGYLQGMKAAKAEMKKGGAVIGGL